MKTKKLLFSENAIENLVCTCNVGHFVSLSERRGTAQGALSSFWWNFHYWLHRKLSKWLTSNAVSDNNCQNDKIYVSVPHMLCLSHDDVKQGKHFPRYWLFVRGCFLWSAPEQIVEQTMETPMIWDASVLIMTSPLWQRCGNVTMAVTGFRRHVDWLRRRRINNNSGIMSHYHITPRPK